MHSSKTKSSLVVGGLLLVGLSLLSHARVTLAQTKVGDKPFQPLGAVFNESERVMKNPVRLVLFRPEASTENSEVSRINVNGAYHTSLMSGAYSVLCLPPGPVALEVRAVKPLQRASEQADMSTQIQLNAGQTVYLSASLQGNNRFSLRPVEALSARESLKTLREQVHALSRVPQARDCNDPDAVLATTPVEPTPTLR